MKSKINKILDDIEKKKQELILEYWKLMKKYGFQIRKWRVIFTPEKIKENKKQKKSIWKSIFNVRIRELLSIPFIYVMIIPAIILDIMLFMYQQTAFRLYKIPLVKRSEYIIFDRNQLDYLNFIQKINCNYCSYFNWLMAFAVEVAWRTERYWCPIKNSRKLNYSHKWHKQFSDYWDPEWFKETFSHLNKLDDLKK